MTTAKTGTTTSSSELTARSALPLPPTLKRRCDRTQVGRLCTQVGRLCIAPSDVLHRLRCGLGISASWTDFVDLPYENRLFRETRSVTCKRGLVATGLRVYRGFQEWGDLDTYEFQLYCSPSSGTSTSELSFNKGEL